MSKVIAADAQPLPPARWMQRDGAPVSCEDKIRTLNANLAELRQVAQDAFEDALLMGVDESHLRAVFRAAIEQLENPYA